MAELSFLGVGWRFPVQVDAGPGLPGRIAVAAYEQSIEESIRIVLGTARGERLMRPDFGSELKRLVFAANNTATAGLAMFYARKALAKWEPRIELLSVDADPDPEEPHTLLVKILYKVIATNNERNLVYPFYLGSA
jgi:phage baseplate assembly protein W